MFEAPLLFLVWSLSIMLVLVFAIAIVQSALGLFHKKPDDEDRKFPGSLS